MLFLKWKISVLAKNEWSGKFLKDQLIDIFNDMFLITYHSPDMNPVKPIYNSDLILCHEPSALIDMMGYIKRNIPVLIMKRTISKEALEKLKKIPKNKKALVVNMDSYMVQETLTNIYQLGINEIQLISWYKDKGPIPKTDYIITPRIYDFLPKTNAKIITIGSRLLKLSFVSDIISYFDIDFKKAEEIIRKHSMRVPAFWQGVNYLLENTKVISAQWNILFKKFPKGVLVINEKNEISVINNKASSILDISNSHFNNKPLDDFILEKPSFKILKSKIDFNDELVNYNGKDLIISTYNLDHDNLYCGKIVIIDLYKELRDTQQKIHRKIVGSGHYSKYTFDNIIGENQRLLKAIDLSKKIANSNSSILINGESGTGKEIMAGAIHNYSNRKNKPFLAINCASLPSNLLESELFGYEEGAFSGAKKGGKVGLFKKAHGGTLFLDEIGEIPLKIQPRLLRALQEKEIRRVGGDSIIRVDVRIIAATNKDLLSMVKKGLFRKDLFFRLNVFQIMLPNLKKRKSDIALLTKHFLKEFKVNRNITKEFKLFVKEYDWPGNIRELKNLLEYMIVTSKKDLTIKALPEYVKSKNLLHNIIYNKDLKLHELLMLKSIYAREKHKLNTGRRSLKEYFSINYYEISEMETRDILHRLIEKSFINISKGPLGCSLTQKAKSLLEDL